MTTTVSIVHEGPEGHAVDVEVYNVAVQPEDVEGKGIVSMTMLTLAASTRLHKPGDKTVAYVYANQMIQIKEISVVQSV